MVSVPHVTRTPQAQALHCPSLSSHPISLSSPALCVCSKQTVLEGVVLLALFFMSPDSHSLRGHMAPSQLWFEAVN